MFSKLKVAIIRRIVRKRLGRDIAPLANASLHPDYLVAYARFDRALDKTNLVSAKLKRLGQIRAAKLVECPF